MIKSRFLIMKAVPSLWLLICRMAVSGCAVNVSQTPPQPTSSPEIIATATAPRRSTPDINVTPPNVTPTYSLSSITVPVTWGNLNLTGRLIYLTGVLEDNTFTVDIDSLDLVSGVITTIFKGPKYSWIYYVSVSPDAQQLIMSYIAPPTATQPARALLYLLPLDGSLPPQLLFAPPTAEDDDIQVEWSPDGKHIYFTQVNYHLPSEPNQINPIYNIFRMEYPNGQPEMIAEKAYWPRLSLDSTRLVYVYVDPLSFKNRLFVADSDGGNAHQVAVSGSWNPDTKDAPLYAPDGQSIIFSAVVPLPSYRPGWVDKMMGILPAKADGSIPSDWWSVPIGGGTLKRLTHIQSLGLFASLSPDQQHLASFSSDGVFVMNPDGSNLSSLVPNMAGISGTISWIP